MKLHTDNLLYIEFKDFIAAGWKEDTIKKANLRNGSNWQMVRNPADKRMPMVAYDTLVDSHKEKLQGWLRLLNGCKHEGNCDCGNPYSYIAKAPIRAMWQKDFAAEQFYTGYKYQGPTGNDNLPMDVVRKYTHEASWLNLLNTANADIKTIVKKTLNLSLDKYYQHVTDLLKNDINSGLLSGKFPTTYQRLLDKMRIYKEGGYPSLIHPNYGNKSAAKINDGISQAALLELIAHPNQYDDVMVCMMYNHWAVKNDYKEIETGSVGVWRRKKEADITTSRYGSDAFNEKYTRQVKGLKVSKAGYLWESDDYNINLYFQNGDNEFARYVSYIVADSKFGLVLGKSYRPAKSPVVDMVRLAYIDAMYYVRRLTGGWHLPFEIKTDRWQQSTLFPWFETIAKFAPPAKGNKHRGYIEQLFGSPHAKRAEKLAAHAEVNYNGNNLTAANRGVNIEALNNNKKSRPLIGTASDTQVEKFFYLMQQMPAFTRNNMEAPSKEQQWLADWNTLTPEQKRPISDEQFLMLFGIQHLPQGRSITITNRGIEPQICGTQYSYDLPDYAGMTHHIGKKVHCLYDPYDMSRILVTDGEGLRFVATTAQLIPRALQDATTGSRAALNMVLDEKKLQVANAGTAANNRQDINTNYIDDKAVILSGYMPKEQKNRIEYQALQYVEEADYNPLEDM